MKRTIVFTTLLATAVGFFALGDMQRSAYHAGVRAEQMANTQAPLAAWQVVTTESPISALRVLAD